MARRKLAISNVTKSTDLSGRVYIVTGANSGVGLETTRQLIMQGAHVVMACRRVEAGQKVAETFKGLKGSFDVLRLDLSDLQSVRDFVKSFLRYYKRLDGLDCNAGMVAMGNEVSRTKNGFEMSIGVTDFGHFLLVESLLDMLKESKNGRIELLPSGVSDAEKISIELGVSKRTLQRRLSEEHTTFNE